MSKKAHGRGKPNQPKRKGLSRRTAAVVTFVVLSLSLTGIVLTQLRAARVTTTTNAMLAAPAAPAPATLSPASPSKEYVYAGGRLVATEEPTPTPAPPAGGQTEEVVWTNYIGAAASGNTLTKTATAGWGNAGAVSTRGLASGDGFVEFTAAETNTTRMCGLSDGDSTQSYPDIKYAFNINSAGNVYIYESGTQIILNGSAIITTYVAGDRFRIAVEGGAVKYRKNGTLLYTNNVAPAYPLLVDTSLYSANSTIADAYIAGNLTDVLPDGKAVRDVVWTNAVGVTAAGNDLTKTAAAGWDAGASSTRSLLSGDGFVEFTAEEVNRSRMCGLSAGGDASQSYTEIDFAIYPRSDGNISVYESGVARSVNGSTIIGTYVAGDRLRVSVEGGQVKYWKVHQGAATLLYTSGVVPAYPLVVDTSLYSNGATIKDAVVAGFAP